MAVHKPTCLFGASCTHNDASQKYLQPELASANNQIIGGVEVDSEVVVEDPHETVMVREPSGLLGTSCNHTDACKEERINIFENMLISNTKLNA